MRKASSPVLLATLTLAWFALAITGSVTGANATPFTWSFSGTYTSGPDQGTPVFGSGTLDATFTSGTLYIVTAMSGTLNGSTPISLNAVNNYAGNDNKLYYPGFNPPVALQQLNFNGLSFLGNGQAFDLYFLATTSGNTGDYDCGVAGYCLIGPGSPGTSGLGNPDDPYASISFSAVPISETPLPGALPLFATGFGLMGLLGWRRKRRAAAVA